MEPTLVRGNLEPHTCAAALHVLAESGVLSGEPG